MRRWATFDCYGTLIDWNGGMTATFERLWRGEDAASLLARYHRLEPGVQRSEPTLAYREVMARGLERLAGALGLPVAPASREALAASLPDWPAFPEVPASLAELRRRGWRLAILSNTDPDLLAASVRHLGIAFDELVIASEIGSYKPAPGHWREFGSRTGASIYHDIGPATALGLRTVWINHLGETAELPPTRELPDLTSLPDTLDELIR